MAKVSLKVYNQAGEKVSTVSLSEEVFGIVPHTQAIYDAIRVYRNNSRQATAKTKTRSEVQGSGKKPWRQKGTGRARAGTRRSPVWVGGGNVFGPKGMQSFVIKQNRKEYRLALKSALSLRAKTQIKVLDKLTLENAKTKEMIEILAKLETGRKVLLVIEEMDEHLILASRNISHLKVVLPSEVNVYDLIWASDILMTKEAIKKIEEALG